MYNVVLEKLLVEHDFLIDFIGNPLKTLSPFDLSKEQINTLTQIADKTVDFFTINLSSFYTDVLKDDVFKSEIISFAKEKITFILAGERAGQQFAVVWISDMIA